MDYPNLYPPYPYGQMPVHPLQGMVMPAAAAVQSDPAMPSPRDASMTYFMYPQNLSNALSRIEKAVAGEAEDTQFYEWLLQHASSAEEQQIISGIRENEMQHYRWFRQLYMELTGRAVPSMPGEAFVPPATYCEGLKRALMGEQNAVRNYRQILYALQNRVQINMLTEIITDELRHGILYNYLYAKNACKA